MEEAGGRLLLMPTSTAPLCDCALSHSLGRLLLHAHPALANTITNSSIILTAHVGAFLSKVGRGTVWLSALK